MSDPRTTDPRLSEPPLQDEFQQRNLGEVKSSNAMWGWVAGGILLALLMMFVFGRTTGNEQLSNSMTAPPPGESTLSPPSAPPTPPTAQNPSPTTTGQGAR